MQSFLYAYFLIGSFSLGYSLLKIGFPERQKAPLIQRIGLSYVFGLVVFGIGYIAGQSFGAIAFLIISLFCYFFFATLMYGIRRVTKRKDGSLEVIKKPSIPVPEKALTREEKAAIINSEKSEKEIVKPKEVQPEVQKEQLFKVKESNVIAELRKKAINQSEQEKPPEIKVEAPKTDEKEKELNKLREYAKNIKKDEQNDKEEMEEEVVKQNEEEEEY